ncbi:hypothetical protein H0H92_005319, partial [Tricholoma furcatifolium]
PDSLDTLLPLLIPITPSHQSQLSIAQLLASAIRIPAHRTAVTEWLPPSERTKAKEAAKPRRGWEKVTLAPGPARMGGWAVRQLLGLISDSGSSNSNPNLKLAALGALGALVKDSEDVAVALARPAADREGSLPMQTIISHLKSRSHDVQLAACLCASHLHRALPRTQQDEAVPRAIMNTINRMIAAPLCMEISDGWGCDNTAGINIGGTEAGTASASGGATGSGGKGAFGQVSIAQRTRACWVLFHLVSDDAALCQIAFERGCLAQLVGLVTALPLPPTPAQAQAELLVDLGSPGPGAGTEGVDPGSASISGSGTGGGGQRGSGTGMGTGRVYVPPVEDGGMDMDMGDGQAGARTGTAGAKGGGGDVRAVWEEWCEPEGRAALREAALTAIAAISLFDNDVRRALTEPSAHTSYHHPHRHPSYYAPSSTLDPSSSTNQNPQPTPSAPASSSSASSLSSSPPPPPLLPVLLLGLAHPSTGVRYASCQCVRAMSRAVAVLRTNIVDSGLGLGVWKWCVKGRGSRAASSTAEIEADTEGLGGEREGDGDEEEEEEDPRVLGAGLAVVCNLVNDFSPLRAVLLEDGLVARLVEILELTSMNVVGKNGGGKSFKGLGATNGKALRVNALWAVKNVLYKSSTELKGRVMSEVVWGRIVGYLEDPDPELREQAFNVLRNVAESEAGVALIHAEIGEDVVLDHAANALKSTNDDVVLQAAYLLANLANYAEAQHQARILAHPKILSALHAALVAATTGISVTSPASPSHAHASSLSSHGNHTPRAQSRGPLVACVAQLAMADPKQVGAAGFEGPLRHVCEWGAGGLGGAVGGSGAGVGGLSAGLGGVGGIGRGAVGGPGWDEDRQVVERASAALRAIEMRRDS